MKIDNAASPQIEYRYDASGNLAIVKDNLRNITTTLEYDLANRLSKITDSQGHAITVGFDAKNRLSGVTEVLKGTTYTSSYTYNADNQPATVSADGKTHSYTYDLLGRLSGTSLNTATPYTTALTYKTHPSTGSSSHVLDSYRSGSTTTTYQVDANGNITELSDGTYTFTYEYDDFNQLIRENNPLLNKSITYQYDLGGNLKEVNEYAYTTGDLGSPTSTIVYTYGSAWTDQLTSIGSDGLTYDANGNLLSYKTRSYSWQAGRQLAQITDTDEDNIFTADYTYNESGIRTRKVVNGVITDYVLEGGKVILETTGNDTLHYSYDSRGQLVSFSLNGTPYFYTRNGQGDITGLIDASVVEVVRYTYDSWGKPVSITDTSSTGVGAKNPYRYRGYRYDTESGLYYLQSRYYDPSIKRFISADGLVDFRTLTSVNLYTYCVNNPIRYSDENGFAFFETLGKALRAGTLLYQCVKGFASGTLTQDKIISDIQYYSEKNTDTDVVRKANLFSSYNGVFVVIVDAPSAYSYGSTLYLRKSEDPETIQHEYGHSLQEDKLGGFAYTVGIAIPSVTYNAIDKELDLPDNIYFSMPWEITADMFGGVKRGQSYYLDGAREAGLDYFRFLENVFGR